MSSSAPAEGEKEREREEKQYRSFEGRGDDGGDGGGENDSKKKKPTTFMGKAWRWMGICKTLLLHLGYVLIATAVIVLLKKGLVDPDKKKSLLRMILCGRHMTKLWVTILGIVFPFCLTLRALITLETDDDRYWLTYWTVFAFYTFMTVLFEEILFEDEWLWYAVQGAIYVWLYLPTLHGCTLVAELLLEPYVLPLISKLTSWLGRNVTLTLILGSLVNVLFVSALFLFLLPFCSTYIGVTLVGIVYPFFCSLAVIAPPTQQTASGEEADAEAAAGEERTGGGGGGDSASDGTFRDTQWLTYWLVFAAVHFVDVWYDNLLDHSYWFKNFWYKFALPFVVWLQIPFFHGAEYIFLHVICPVFGLHVHRFHYAASPWQEAPQAVNYITYSKNISGFVGIVQGMNGGAGEKKQ